MAVLDSEDRPWVPRGKTQRSRLTNGNTLLPNQDGRSVWARIMRDTVEALTAHCGGDGHITEPMRLMARRVAAMEAELVFLEDRFAQLRVNDNAPTADDLDLYNRLAGGQRRLLASLGLEPRLRPVNGSGNGHAEKTFQRLIDVLERDNTEAEAET